MFLRDPEFLRSLRTTAIYAVGLNPIMWAIALALALLFNQEMRMRGVFRTIFFTPVVVSWVVASMVWYLIFHRSFGLNAHIMRFFGQPGIKLLEDSQYALLAIIVLSLWKSMGYYMVLFLAGHLGLDKPGTIAFCFSNHDEDRTVATLPPLEPY